MIPFDMQTVENSKTENKPFNKTTARYLLAIKPKTNEAGKIKRFVRCLAKKAKVYVPADMPIIEIGRFEFPPGGRQFLVNRLKKLASESSAFTLELDSLEVRSNRLIACAGNARALARFCEKIDGLSLVDEIRFEDKCRVILTKHLDFSKLCDISRYWPFLKFNHRVTSDYLYLVEWVGDEMWYDMFKVGNNLKRPEMSDLNISMLI